MRDDNVNRLSLPVLIIKETRPDNLQQGNYLFGNKQ